MSVEALGSFVFSDRQRRLVLALLGAIGLAAGGRAARVKAQDSAADALYKRTISAYNAGLIDQAYDLASQAIRANPKDPKLFLARGHLHQYRRQYRAAVEDFTRAIELNPAGPEAYQRRAEESFKLRQYDRSVRDFLKVIAIRPERGPYLWQLGISQYLAGDYEAARSQFEAHQKVNSDDVENAVWHFLCVAEIGGVQEAKKRLLPIAHDARVPMMRIYALFAGRGSEAEVLRVAHQGHPARGQLNQQIFYAHLYLGLYFHAMNAPAKALSYAHKAAQQYKAFGYMGEVARVFALWLEKHGPKPKEPASGKRRF